MLTRRAMLTTGATVLAGTTLPGVTRAAATGRGMVSVAGTGFRLNGAPYRYAGANMWYGAYLGADAPYGNRDRLKRELDRLVALGVDNIRVLGASEASPLSGAVTPTFRDRGPKYNETLLRGLDYFLAEMGRRNMRAVVYLNNFWPWSGGMGTYLYWTNGGRYMNSDDPAHPWPEYADFTGQFYGNRQAVALADDYVRTLVGRTNSITGKPYADDPAIMAWQLANEPRPGETAAKGYLPAYTAWIRSTARLIKSIDRNHLVSVGAEGTIGCLNSEAALTQATPAEIDYMTIHIWPQNFGWIDPKNLAGTRDQGEAKTRAYIDQHVALATRLKRPLVIEEFGYPRDEVAYDPGTPTTHKDRYYALIMDAVATDAARGGPLSGFNFWAWNGEGRAQHADHRFRAGDTNWLGDPSHEPQGWYGVFDRDASTQAVIRENAAALRRIAVA